MKLPLLAQLGFLGNTNGEYNEDVRKAHLILPIQFALLGLLILGLATTVWNKHYSSLPVLLAGAIVATATVVLLYFGRVRLASTSLMVAMLLIEFLLLCTGNGIHDITIIIYPIILVMSSLLLEKKPYILVSLLVILSTAGIILLELGGVIASQTSMVTDITDLVLVPAILSLTAWALRMLTNNLNSSLEQSRQLTRLQANLIDEIRRRAEHLTILNRVVAAVTSGLDLEHVLSSLYDRIQEVVPNDTFSVALFDPAAGQITFPLFIDLGVPIDVLPEEVREQPGLTGEVIQRKRTIYIPDMHDPQEMDGLSAILLGASSTRTYVGVPLFLNDQVIGVLSVQSQSPFAYHPDQIRLLETIGNHAVIAIHNARLYATLAEELEERRRVENALQQRDSILEAITLAAGKFLKQPDWRANIAEVLERLGREIGCTHASIFQAGPKDDRELSITLTYSWSTEGSATADTTSQPVIRFAVPEWGPLFEVMRRGESVQGQISQITPEQGERLARWGVRSYLNAPILIDGELWGLIGFYDSLTERTWSQTEVDAILIAAGLLGAAIQRQIADERIHRMNADLENRVRERTADLESFAYSVAHDLRAPLRGIDGYSKLLLDEYGHLLSGEGQEYVENVRHGAQFMGQLIEDLLKLSRVTRLEMRNTLVDLSQNARETCSSLQAQSPNRQVDWSVQPDMYVVGDPTLLRLAVDNLLLNAWKFTNQKAAACVEVGFYDDDHNQRIFFIRDNGVGFDMRYADKLFSPFQRLHQPGEFEGTGIGLATVKRIIQRHNGEIWAESTIGEGATFYFTIPA